MAELFREGLAVYEAGCREPMVAYAYGWSLDRMRKENNARRVLLQAASTMSRAEYPLHWSYAAESRFAMNLRRDGQFNQADMHRRAACDLLLRAIGAGEFNGRERMLIPKLTDTCGGHVPLEIVKPFIDKLKQIEGLDPCTLHTVLGDYHIRRAWDYRGPGLADSIPEKDKAGFRRHLDLARTHLEKAHALDPTRPEAAASMLVLCKAQHAPSGTALADWIGRAMEAQIDYIPAFDQVLSALQPRWGGTHQETLDFGLACAASGRYDTELPLVLLAAVRQVQFDRLTPGDDVLDSPRLYERLMDEIERTASHPNHHHRRHWLQSVAVAIAFQAGRLDEAKTMALALGDDIDVLGLHYFRMDRSDVDRLIGGRTVVGANR